MRLGEVDLAYIAANHEGRLVALERWVTRANYWAGRVAIVAALWLIAVVANLNVDAAAALLVAVLKKL